MSTTLFSVAVKTNTRLHLTVKENNVPVDISNDVLKLYVIQDHKVLKTVLADVTTGGATGDAFFNLSQSDTFLPYGIYRGEIVWYRQDGKIYLLLEGTIEIARRDSATQEI